MTQVEELTGFPECLDGRVKTLHPKVHAGILADTRNPDHVQQLADLGVEAFDLVVVNLYPFRETVASGASEDECVEQIDIGGPSMVRASAKNHASVAIVTSPAAYGHVVEALGAGGFTLTERRRLAAEAFVHTASYDNAVASWMGTVVADTTDGTGFPAWTGATFDRSAVLRYGENPHQGAALYRHWRPGVASAEQLHGKEMSYNNYVDTDAAVRAAHDHGDQPTVAIIKHANPCGIAVGGTIEEAYERAHATDPVSAYGGIIAANRTVTAAMAAAAKPVFTEVIIAPDYEPEALEILTAKKNLRILRLPAGLDQTADPIETRAISGGLLVQTVDKVDAVVRGESGDVTVATTRATGAWSRVTSPTTRRSPICSSRGGRSVRSSRTRSCSRTTAPPSASAWARSTASTPATSRCVAPARSARVARSRRPTRSSRSPMACRSCSTPGCERSSRPAARSATGRSSRPRRLQA